MKKLIGFVLFVILVNSTSAQNQVALTDQEGKGLQFMREEEKLARDVYDSMYMKWNVNPFGNIRQSERVHMARMKDMLEKYSVKDPVDESQDKAGVFQNKELQAIYVELVRSGSKSLTDALNAGAEIEELDIADLDKRMAGTQKEDILSAYQFLRMGSEHHLQAFVRRLRSQGVTYVPKHLSLEEFNKIINSRQ